MPLNTKVAPTMLARFTGWRTASIAPRSWSATESIRTEGVGVMTNQPTSAKGSAAEYRVKVTRQSKSWVTPPEISGSTARPVVSTAEAGAEAVSLEGETEIEAQIRDLLDTRVRPAVAQDGGDIVFQRFEEGVVYLHMQGSCSGCPSSTATLKMGIENLLRHYVPEVTEVRAVD